MGLIAQVANSVIETGFVSPMFVGGIAVGALIVAGMMVTFVYFEREMGDMASVTGLTLVVLAFVFGPTVEMLFKSVGGVLTAVFVLASLIFARSAISFVFSSGQQKEASQEE